MHFDRKPMNSSRKKEVWFRCSHGMAAAFVINRRASDFSRIKKQRHICRCRAAPAGEEKQGHVAAAGVDLPVPAPLTSSVYDLGA
jgi:hypothetical protein